MSGYMTEIKTVQQLQHPNIIHYNAVFQDGDSMYIEMEYCKHGNLIQWMTKQQPGKAQKQSVLRQILLALACTCVCVCVCVCVCACVCVHVCMCGCSQHREFCVRTKHLVQA